VVQSEGEDFGCTASGGDRPLIYNLTDSTGAPSIIDWVFNVWPATSSNVGSEHSSRRRIDRLAGSDETTELPDSG
jgi:hypothetical protein